MEHATDIVTKRICVKYTHMYFYTMRVYNQQMEKKNHLLAAIEVTE